MRVNLSIWDKLTRFVVILLVLAGLLGIGVWYLPLLEQNRRLRQDILRREQEIRKEEETAKKLKASINALQKDTKTVERLARERLGYAKPGETVIRFEAPATNPAPTGP
jgi:cell division protein FtsB